MWEWATDIASVTAIDDSSASYHVHNKQVTILITPMIIIPIITIVVVVLLSLIVNILNRKT